MMCPDCGKYFVNENSLNKHYKQYYSTVLCDFRSEIVLEAMLDKPLLYGLYLWFSMR